MKLEIPIFKKTQYSVTAEFATEIHYIIWRLSIDLTQRPQILLIKEYWHKQVNYAEILWRKGE